LLFTDNIQRHYVHTWMRIVAFLFCQPPLVFPLTLSNLKALYLLGDPSSYPSTPVLGLLSTVLPLLLNLPRRHPADKVTYLHRRHQQHQPSCLIHLGSSEVLQKGCLFFGNGATLLQMSLEVIQYPMPTALESSQYPLAKD
jgi:hypothetical protein